MWGLTRPYYGLSTARNDLYVSIRDFFSGCGCGSTTLGNSVCFSTSRDFSYNSGAALRDQASENIYRIILRMCDCCGGAEKRYFAGVIATHVDDLLRTGCGAFIQFISNEMMGGFGVETSDGGE